MLSSKNKEQSTKHKVQSTKTQSNNFASSRITQIPQSCMSQLEPPTPESDKPTDEGQVVYRRTPHGSEDVPAQGETIQARAREIAPAITPLIIGFAVLLALIFVLGYLSIRRMDEVSYQGRELELQHSARLSLLLNLRLALTKLDNEVRLRHEAEARGELKPPFDLRLSKARDEINSLLPQIERPRSRKIRAGASFDGICDLTPRSLRTCGATALKDLPGLRLSILNSTICLKPREMNRTTYSGSYRQSRTMQLALFVSGASLRCLWARSWLLEQSGKCSGALERCDTAWLKPAASAPLLINYWKGWSAR